MATERSAVVRAKHQGGVTEACTSFNPLPSPPLKGEGAGGTLYLNAFDCMLPINGWHALAFVGIPDPT